MTDVTAAQLRELLREAEAREAKEAEPTPTGAFVAELRDGKFDPRRLADVIERLGARGLLDDPEEPAEAEADDDGTVAAEPVLVPPSRAEEV